MRGTAALSDFGIIVIVITITGHCKRGLSKKPTTPDITFTVIVIRVEHEHEDKS